MADDVVNDNPAPTDPNQPNPGETPAGDTDGPHPTPEGTPENVNTGAAAPADEAEKEDEKPSDPAAGVNNSSDLRG